MQKVAHLSVQTRAQKAAGRRSDNGEMPDYGHSLEPEQEQPDSPYPFLEKALSAVKKHPNSALAAMIAIAGTVIAAITVLSVSIIGGMFLMYGQMREVSATQRTLLSQYQETRAEVRDTGNIMRTYENMNGKRTEFLISLMDPAQQARYREWERTHPFPLLPAAPKQLEDKEN